MTVTNTELQEQLTRIEEKLDQYMELIQTCSVIATQMGPALEKFLPMLGMFGIDTSVIDVSEVNLLGSS